MKHFLIILFMSFASFSTFANDHCVINAQSNIVLLKLDDVTGVSKNWQKMTDFLESNHMAASYGVIGDSLETDNPSYLIWLKERVKNGQIELWNHGYISNFMPNILMGEHGEFDGTSAQAQADALGKTQALAKQKIGVTFKGFGPHNSAVDDKTYAQLASFKEINYVWFYQPVGLINHAPFLFQRVANLEHPIFRPNIGLFKKDYEKRPKNLGYIALQGHPNMWNEEDFEQFIQIINFLKNEKAQFCKPSQVLKTQIR